MFKDTDMNLYYRFLKFLNSAEQGRYIYYRQKYGIVYSLLMAKANRRRIWLDRLEIPITTYCSLCCRHCANLMQYYTERSHIPAKQVTENLSEVLDSIDGVHLLRILGGEPLLHPELYEILQFCITCMEKSGKIRGVEIVTNGTMLLSEDTVELLKNSDRIKLGISDYGANSSKLNSLTEQLEEAHILYDVYRGEWKAKASLAARGWSDRDKRKLFRMCKKYISLFNGELHICPRSAHGTDLCAVPRREGDYVRIAQYGGNPEALRSAIIKLLERPYVEACSFCDGERPNDLETVVRGEQCSRDEARRCFQEMMRKNRMIFFF